MQRVEIHLAFTCAIWLFTAQNWKVFPWYKQVDGCVGNCFRLGVYVDEPRGVGVTYNLIH